MYNADSPAELDPLGSSVGFYNPYNQGQNSPQNMSAGGWGYGSWGDPFGGYSCYVDWMPRPCSDAAGVLSAGAGAIYNGPSEYRVTYQGRTQWAYFRVFADGYSGYIPGSARYLGSGRIEPIGGYNINLSGHQMANELLNIARLSGLNVSDVSTFNHAVEFGQVLNHTGVDSFWQNQAADKRPYINQRERVGDGLLDFWRTLLEKAVNIDSCKQFLDKYVGGANLLEVFDTVRKQRGIAFNPATDAAMAAGQASETVLGGFDGALIDLTTSYKGSMVSIGNGASLLNVEKTVNIIGTLIHELIHASQKGRNDFDMDKLLRKNGELVLPEAFATSNQSAASISWNSVLGSNKYCNLSAEMILGGVNK